MILKDKQISVSVIFGCCRCHVADGDGEQGLHLSPFGSPSPPSLILLLHPSPTNTSCCADQYSHS
ncbi:hypothetical protein J6590_099861, partial [Homalodisca vitripennis]